MGSSLALVKGKAAICDFSTSFFLCATVAVADQLEQVRRLFLDCCSEWDLPLPTFTLVRRPSFN